MLQTIWSVVYTISWSRGGLQNFVGAKENLTHIIPPVCLYRLTMLDESDENRIIVYSNTRGFLFFESGGRG